MNREETKQILKKLSDAFPLMRKDINRSLVNTWTEAFSNRSFPAVHQAVIKYINFNKDHRPPTIADIKAMLPALQTDVIFTRAYDLVGDEILPIKYHINQHGDIEDEQGRIYFHPNPTIYQMMKSRVMSTGMILTQAEADAEYKALEAKKRS